MSKITCGNIGFTEECICELDGLQEIVSIHKKDITSLSIRFGRSVEKPILQFVGGIIMCLMGFVIGVWPLADALFHPEVVVRPNALKLFALASPLLFVGVAVIWPIFRKCHYVPVRTYSDKRKIPIKGCSTSEVISAGRSLGYSISEE